MCQKLICESDLFKVELFIWNKKKKSTELIQEIHVIDKNTKLITSRSKLINNQFIFYGRKLDAIILFYNSEYFNIIDNNQSLFELTYAAQLKVL